ncbi:hypothetical protein AW736_25365 [Termitidicoccus mucosus]|uniref:Uncharacterized protein n=2 Tax=Termitidicoccus mucosus TaxID=1184151 RepID=A0A178IB99_9BACT|nr:hypothetical protein AW736_25365 [Opitutaceae bacterium TSB47]
MVLCPHLWPRDAQISGERRFACVDCDGGGLAASAASCNSLAVTWLAAQPLPPEVRASWEAIAKAQDW